jgi:transcriptional regulator with XRE-family HTH domain
MPYRKTAIRHPLARVRSIIAIDQRTLHRRVGCSLVTIKRIEQGTLPLSRTMAERLETALGVSAAYLRHGKASKPPTTPTGEPFTNDTYARRQLELREGTLIQSAAFFPFRWAARLGAIASKAGEKHRLLAFHYKVEALALELQNEFGIDQEDHERLKRICSGSGLLTVGAHDEKMPPSTFAQLAEMDGLPYKATTKTSTAEEHEAAQAKAAGLTVPQYRKKQARDLARWEKNEAAKASDKLQAKKAGLKRRR